MDYWVTEERMILLLLILSRQLPVHRHVLHVKLFVQLVAGEGGGGARLVPLLVGALVFAQVVGPRESLAAASTREPLLTSVGAQVAQQLVRPRE